MRSEHPGPGDRAGNKKPGKREGLPGLLIYGVLTILGGLALVIVAE